MAVVKLVLKLSMRRVNNLSYAAPYKYDSDIRLWNNTAPVH